MNFTTQQKQEVKRIYAYCEKNQYTPFYTGDHTEIHLVPTLTSFASAIFPPVKGSDMFLKLALELRLLLGPLLILKQEGRKSRAQS